MRDVGSPAAPVTFVSNALRRHVLLIVLLTVLGAAAGVGAAVKQGIEYTASASILVNPLQGNPFAPDGRGEQLVNLETEAQLVGTEGVAALAARTLKTDLDIEQLHEQVKVENPTNTQVLRISFTGGSRSEALRGAQAFAQAYLNYRAARAKSITDDRLARVRKQQTTIQSKLADVTAELADTSEGSSRRAYLEERTSALASQVASLETEVSTLTAADLEPGQVISPSTLPLTAGGTNAVLFGGAGVFGGFVVAVLLALLRTRADDRLHDPHEVEDFDLRLLGVIEPKDRFSPRGDTRARLRTLPEPYRELRTAIINSIDTPPVALTIASVSPSVSAAPDAAGLATGLARAGFSVVVVDTTGETTQLLAGNSALPGLSGLLAGTTDLRHVLVQPEDHLVLLPSGKPQRDTMDQLLSPQMRATVRSLREWYDYVLITGQPVTSADGQALASLSDAILLVAARRQSTRAELEASATAMARVRSIPVGIVVVEGKPSPGSPQRPSTGPETRPQPAGSGAALRARTAAPRAGEPPVGRSASDPAAVRSAGDPAVARSGSDLAGPRAAADPAAPRAAGEPASRPGVPPARTTRRTPSEPAAEPRAVDKTIQLPSTAAADNGHAPATGRSFHTEDR